MLKQHHACACSQRNSNSNTHGNAAKQQFAHGRADGDTDRHADGYAGVWIVHANIAQNGPKGSFRMVRVHSKGPFLCAIHAPTNPRQPSENRVNPGIPVNCTTR
jgi:hypothetical protein